MIASSLQTPPPNGTKRATFDFATHPCFPMVKLADAKTQWRLL